MLLVATAGIVTNGFATAGATSPPALAPRGVQSLAGELLVAHGDNFRTGAMVMQTALRTDTGVVPLALPASEHAQTLALAGTRVRVVGSRLAQSVAAPRLAPVASARVAAAPGAKRPMRIALVLLRLPGTKAEPVSRATAQARVFGAKHSVADWFAQTSGGQLTITGTVFGYYNGVNSCDLATQLARGAAAAAASGYSASKYDHLVVYEPAQVCDFGGIGWVGASGVFLNGSLSQGLVQHELGHNLGLWHAGAYDCGSMTQSQQCLIAYGDPTDVMGTPAYNRGYNAEHKRIVGWLPASEVRAVRSGTQTIALTASENPRIAGAIELIHVRAADGTLYAIDRRASVGYDTGLSGVWIRRVASVHSDDTELVRQSALRAGQTFTDPVHHVTIRTMTDRGARASIRVCIGACHLTRP